MMLRGRLSRSNPDAGLLLRVRLRLIAWSAASTLVVLVVLGGSLYLVVAQSLVSQSTQTLQYRVDQLRAKLVGAADETGSSPSGNPTASGSPTANGDPAANGGPESVNVTVDASQSGMAVGGPSWGTIAFTLDPGSDLPVKLVPPSVAGSPATYDIPEPDAAYRDAARSGRTVVWEADLHGTAAQFLLVAVPTTTGSVLIEAIDDRTAEVVLLRTLLTVLLIGGLLALVASIAFGYLYAGRALVPIRGSLQRQRDFAADASHELRTPLAIVRGAVEELRAGMGAGGNVGPETRERSLADIEAGTQRLGRLVDDLLLLARADSGTVELVREPVDLADIATDVTGAFARRATDAEVHLRLDVEPAPVLGDRARLGQLVGIVLDNAIKHSPRAGVVAVTVRPGATLAIEDEGPGIRPADLPRLFDRFWRAADAPEGGTGLGLAIAAWIARSHGGAISAEQRKALGARFVVTVPAGAAVATTLAQRPD